MNKFVFSAQKFHDTEDIMFNIRDYSNLKYGNCDIARKFSQEMYEKLSQSFEWEKFLEAVGDKDILVAGAPFKYIPVAATFLSQSFLDQLNSGNIGNKKPAIDFKVYRGHSYNVDYGALSAEHRAAALSSDTFHIDGEFIKDKALILIDDVTITGSHEQRMKEVLKRVHFDGPVLFLYYAEYIGEGNPDIENHLNYAALDYGLKSIEAIMKTSDFKLNTRVTKYILEKECVIFQKFIINKSMLFKKNLLYAACGNGYDTQEAFTDNVKYLRKLIY